MFICDASAKTFVLGIVGHTGYHGCTKRASLTSVRVQELNSLRSMAWEVYHGSSSILLELPFDIVRSMPLDSMHLVCLGLMPKVLALWFRNYKGIKLGTSMPEDVSSRNVKLVRFVPSEFSRMPRSLADLGRW